MIERAPVINSGAYDAWISRHKLTRALVATSQSGGFYAVHYTEGAQGYPVETFDTLAEAVTWAHKQVLDAQLKAAFG